MSIGDDTLGSRGYQHAGAQLLDVVDEVAVELRLVVVSALSGLNVKIESVDSSVTEWTRPQSSGILGTERAHEGLGEPLVRVHVSEVVV